MPLTNAREALGAAHGRERGRSASCSKAWRDVFGLDGAARAHRGLRQQPHPGHATPIGAHDRRRARGLHEERIPQVQHQAPRIAAGRRLRHDARGADAPLRPRAARRIPSASDGTLARPGADRRRPGQLDGGLRGAGRARRRRHRRWSASPRAPTATPAASASSCPGKPPFSLEPQATRCSTSCSACATRRTASPSAPTARGAPRRSAQSPLDEIAGHRRRAASGRCCTISARPGRWRGPGWPTSTASPASANRREKGL